MPGLLNVCVYARPRVNAFPTPESKLSPVTQAIAVPPLRAASVVTVCGADVIVHRTVSPAEIVVMAVARRPPVLLVQSTNPISPALATPQGEAFFPILTSTVFA